MLSPRTVRICNLLLLSCATIMFNSELRVSVLDVCSYIPGYFYLNVKTFKNKELKMKLWYFSQTAGVFVDN